VGVVDRINERLLRAQSRDMSLTVDAYAQFFSFGGLTYPLVQTTMGSVDRERIIGSAISANAGNAATFALTVARIQAFSQIRLQWTRFTGSQPGPLWGTDALKLVEHPWPGGRTPQLLARMELDNCLAGNAYIVNARPGRLTRLRPDLVTICLGSQLDAPTPADAPDVEVAGYAYFPRSGKPSFFMPDEVAHYAPLPDPNFQFLGMSWITPCIREIQADSLAVEHKARFFENAAPESVDSLLQTPAGWIRMGDVRLGDRVIGSDGKPHHVTGVFPQGEQDIYRVTFSGGATVECTYDHLWHVASPYDRRRGTHRVISLREIVEGNGRYGAGTEAGAGGVCYDSGPPKWSVPLVEPVQFDDPGLLPVDPYLLGVLLGDGCFRGNSPSLAAWTHDAEDEHDLVAPLLPEGVGMRRRDRLGTETSEFYFGAGAGRVNPLTAALWDLGLWGVRGERKFIPAPYMLASVGDRLAMLQGLLDTDGSVSKRQPNLVRFTSTSRALSEQLADLVGSLGGVAKITPLEKVGVNSKPQWQVTVKRLPEWMMPFRLPRKVAGYQPPSNRTGRWRYITGVEYIGRKPAQCIRVDTPDSLYVTDGYVLTHNTPNLAIKFDPSLDIDAVLGFKKLMENEHRGAFNAYKTLYLGGGADPVVVGKDFQQLDFAVTQGHGESRLAAAAGVPSSWVGFSEGLQGSALNAGNFQSARRRFSDGTMYHLWVNAVAALEIVCPPPDSHANLWFDTRVPFMRDDATDIAAIQAQQAAAISSLIMQGFDPKSVTLAIAQNDLTLLKHTGLTSVQLHPPGQGELLPSGGSSPNGSNGSNGSSGGSSQPGQNGQSGSSQSTVSSSGNASGTHQNSPRLIGGRG
jgi:hypothetical protein